MRALVVGGSGMLEGACRALLADGAHVAAMARSEARIRAIAPSVEPIVCDYNDGAAFGAALAARAPFDLVVAWVHGRAPALRRSLAERVRPGGHFVQVLGSAHGDPSHPERLAEMARAAGGLPLGYQAVVLGFVVESGRSRWLTDDEISQGVFAAIRSGAPLAIVGKVEPWRARP